MRKLVSFNVSIIVDEQNEYVIKGLANKIAGGMTEAEAWEECARLYEEGVIEVLGDEINMDDVVKITVERIHD